MLELSAALATFSSDERTPRALVEHLRTSGISASITQVEGLELVRVDDEVGRMLLVHDADALGLRERLRRLQAVGAGVIDRVVVPGPAPIDVDAVYGESELAKLERVLGRSGELELTRSLGELGAMAGALVTLLERETGVRLDPAGGEETLRRIDALVERLRPGHTEEGHVLPFYTLCALGLVATATVRELAGEDGRLVSLGFDNVPRPVVMLADAEGFPGLMLRNGAIGTNMAQKVVKRWYATDLAMESLAGLWARIQPRLSDTALQGVELHPTLERRLVETIGLSGKAVALMLCNLDEGTACLPSMWTVTPERQVKMGYLQVEGSDQADAMANARIAEAGDAVAVIVVNDVYITTEKGRTDALMARTALPGTDIDVRVCVPYRRQGDRIVFDQAPYAMSATISEAAMKAFMGELLSIDEPVLKRIPTEHGAARAATAPPAPGAASEAILRRACIAPIAGFIQVAAADGELEPRELFAFMLAMNGVSDPLLVELRGHVMFDMTEVTQAMMADPELMRSCLAALGTVFERDPRGPEAQTAFLKVLEDTAAVHGEIRDVEKAAIVKVMALLRGGETVALARPLPGSLESSTLDDVDYGDAAMAPVIAMLMIAAADGQVDANETAACMAACDGATNPLLRAMLAQSRGGDFTAFQALLSNPERLHGVLTSARGVFDTHEQGRQARNELFTMLDQVAMTHGEIREVERQVLHQVKRALAGPNILWLVVGVLSTVLTGSALAVWHLAAGWFGWGSAVAVGSVLQAVLLGATLLLFRSQGKAGTLLTGGLNTLLTALLALVVVALGGTFMPSIASVGTILVATAGVGFLVTAVGTVLARR